MVVFNWGEFVSTSNFQRAPALRPGSVLFFIRNGRVELPGKDLRVLPFQGVTSIGYLNLSPEPVRLDLGRLVSGDGILFDCQVSLNVALKEDENSRVRVASDPRSWGPFLEDLVRETLQKQVKQYSYKNLYNREPGLFDDLVSSVEGGINVETPYRVRRVNIKDLKSNNPGVDLSIQESQEIDLTTETKRKTFRTAQELYNEEQEISYQAQQKEIEYQGKVQIETANIENNLSDIHLKGSIARKEMEFEVDRRIKNTIRTDDFKFRAEELEFRAQLMSKIFKETGNSFALLQLEHPDIAATLENSKNRSTIELASALQQLTALAAQEGAKNSVYVDVVKQFKAGISNRSYSFSNPEKDEAN